MRTGLQNSVSYARETRDQANKMKDKLFEAARHADETITQESECTDDIARVHHAPHDGYKTHECKTLKVQNTQSAKRISRKKNAWKKKGVYLFFQNFERKFGDETVK